jgi:hypothetical protein
MSAAKATPPLKHTPRTEVPCVTGYLQNIIVLYKPAHATKIAILESTFYQKNYHKSSLKNNQKYTYMLLFAGPCMVVGVCRGKS